MKKIFTLLLIAVMCLSLVACGGGEQNNSEMQENQTSSTEESEEMLVVSGSDGTPALNANLVGNYIERVELTVDNWREYLKVYPCAVEVVKKDAFGETTSIEVCEVFCLGYGSERYHSFEATVELKHKETGETIIANMTTTVFRVASEVNLDEYECTRIEGYLYFFNFPEDVMEEVLSVHDREAENVPNANITIVDGHYVEPWIVDTEAKVITNSIYLSWNNYGYFHFE